MSAAVWKHPLRGGEIQLTITRGAKILHFDEQAGVFCLWEAHDPDETRTVSRTFQVVETGVVADVDPVRYLATAQTPGGYVAHLFETTDVAQAGYW